MLPFTPELFVVLAAEPVLLLDLLLEPHPATTNATAAMSAASTHPVFLGTCYLLLLDASD